jgi:hypothetical protein
MSKSKWQKAHALEHLVKLLVPAATTLLHAIEALLQFGRPGAVVLLKALWLVHVDFNVFELALEIVECRRSGGRGKR